jgi:hypothetical protein
MRRLILTGPFTLALCDFKRMMGNDNRPRCVWLLLDGHAAPRTASGSKCRVPLYQGIGAAPPVVWRGTQSWCSVLEVQYTVCISLLHPLLFLPSTLDENAALLTTSSNMPSMVCRLKHCKGKSLGLSIYPASTFLTTPVEIRHQIYQQLLVASAPITVWPKLPEHPVPGTDDQPAMHNLKLGLLLVSKTIALETSAVFYSCNTFHFTGPDTWNPLFSFLSTIGSTNRGHLRRLEATIQKPLRLARHANGTLTAPMANSPSWMRSVYVHDDRHPRLRSSAGRSRHGGAEVDYLSPAIEAIFRLLGPDGAPLQLTLTMPPGLLPGIQLWIDEQCPGSNYWSLELPDHVETLKRAFVTGADGESRMQILWKGVAIKSHFDRLERDIAEVGWEILQVEEMQRSAERWGMPQLRVGFVLQRREEEVVSGCSSSLD